MGLRGMGARAGGSICLEASKPKGCFAGLLTLSSPAMARQPMRVSHRFRYGGFFSLRKRWSVDARFIIKADNRSLVVIAHFT
jgi:hypothetical protein